MIFDKTSMFMMLGLAYCGVAAVLAFSMVFDKSLIRSNYITLVMEVILGIILLL